MGSGSAKSSLSRGETYDSSSGLDLCTDRWCLGSGDCTLMKKITVRVIVVLLPLWIVGCGVIYAMMRKPPETFARFMMRVPGPVAFLAFPFETMWMRARAGQLQIGDPAPDFTLTKLDKSASVQLSTLLAQGHPAVLVFGSYT